MILYKKEIDNLKFFLITIQIFLNYSKKVYIFILKKDSL